jgi:hypothetical protein
MKCILLLKDNSQQIMMMNSINMIRMAHDFNGFIDILPDISSLFKLKKLHPVSFTFCISIHHENNGHK